VLAHRGKGITVETALLEPLITGVVEVAVRGLLVDPEL
jgi:hypothetical protein